MRRLMLRTRIALACGLVGFFLSLCFAAATTWVAEDYEYLLIEAMLAGQARTWQGRLADDPAIALPVSRDFSVYRHADAPAALRDLGDGVHEVDERDDQGLHAAVFGDGDRRVVLVVAVGDIEVLEGYLAKAMVIIVVSGTLLAGVLGWLVARRATWPVTRLVQAVSALPPRPVATRLADDQAADEIGRLAGAIDGYQQRLADADAAERRFFADASHELRTPIAVIQGATEVMKDDADLQSSQGQRLGRIDRALLELTSLLEALLLSARTLPAERDRFDLREAVDAAVARISAADAGWASRVGVHGDGADVPVLAPRRWVDGIVTVLLQRLLGKSPDTRWAVHLVSDGLRVVPAGVAADAPDEPVLRSDLGFNLIFVERLCRNLGWRLEQASLDDGRMSVRVRVVEDAVH